MAEYLTEGAHVCRSRGSLRVFLRTAAFLLAVQSSAMATQSSGSVAVEGSSLIFEGEGLQPPDEEGHFAVGLKLPLPDVSAHHCETPYLIVGIGTLNKPLDELTADDRRTIQKNRDYWNVLKKANDKREAIRIPVIVDGRQVKTRQNKILASYCSLSIDESQIK